MPLAEFLAKTLFAPACIVIISILASPALLCSGLNQTTTVTATQNTARRHLPRNRVEMAFSQVANSLASLVFAAFVYPVVIVANIMFYRRRYVIPDVMRFTV